MRAFAQIGRKRRERSKKTMALREVVWAKILVLRNVVWHASSPTSPYKGEVGWGRVSGRLPRTRADTPAPSWLPEASTSPQPLLTKEGWTRWVGPRSKGSVPSSCPQEIPKGQNYA